MMSKKLFTTPSQIATLPKFATSTLGTTAEACSFLDPWNCNTTCVTIRYKIAIIWELSTM